MPEISVTIASKELNHEQLDEIRLTIEKVVEHITESQNKNSLALGVCDTICKILEKSESATINRDSVVHHGALKALGVKT